MTDFVTVPDHIIDPEEWRSYRARAFIMHMVKDCGGYLLLREEWLTELPVGRLLVEETPDATTYRYVHDETAPLIANQGEIMAAALVHRAGGKVTLTRAQEALFSGHGLVMADPTPRLKPGTLNTYDDIELHLVKLDRPLQEGEI